MVRIGVLHDGSYEVVTVPLETYVARVLTGEALPGSGPAAYQALAIAIRTYTLGNRGRHQAEGFDLCDQTHCQVMRTSTEITERAALTTSGQVLLYKGTPATVYYSASCGGHTEKPSNVWPGADDVPYLPIQDDDGCGGAPEWSTELSLVDFERALKRSGFGGTLRGARIGARNESGRVAHLTLEGMTPSRISGQDLRSVVGRAIGWQYVRSAAFDLERTARGLRFRGHGYGHGVGMCVIGSAKLASSGESATQILARYFPGTEIATVGPRLTAPPPEQPRIGAPPPPRITAIPPAPRITAAPTAPSSPPPAIPADVAVSLPEGEEGERAVLAALAARERRSLSETLAVPVVPRLSLRFHGTTEAFEAATAQPWFALGAVVGDEMHFVPLPILRDNGVLERMVRRQLVHLMVDRELAGRPLWVREGAAIHFAENTMGPGNRGTCPVDSEFYRPASMGALTDVQARARACFERIISTGRSWRDIR